MPKNKGKNKDNLEKTRQVFLDLGHEEFVKNGFLGTSTAKIVERSGMARGSLYYHFKDKRDLFRAVYIEVLNDVYEKTRARMAKDDNNWDAFITGCHTMLDNCLTPQVAKIVLMEGMTTLTHQERLQLLDKNLIGQLRDLIGQLYEDDYFQDYHPQSVLVFVYGLLSEAGRTLNYAEDPQELCRIYKRDFETMMEKTR